MELKGKISAKHYLNKKLKPIIINGKKSYPLYVRLAFQNKFREFKSKAWLFWQMFEEKETEKEIGNFLKRSMFSLEIDNDNDYYFSEKDFNENVNIEPKLVSEINTLIDIVDKYRKRGINIFDNNPMQILDGSLSDISELASIELKLKLRQTIWDDSNFSSLAEIIDWNKDFTRIYSTLAQLFDDTKHDFLITLVNEFGKELELTDMIYQYYMNRGYRIRAYEWQVGNLKKEIEAFYFKNPNWARLSSFIDTIVPRIDIK